MKLRYHHSQCRWIRHIFAWSNSAHLPRVDRDHLTYALEGARHLVPQVQPRRRATLLNDPFLKFFFQLYNSMNQNEFFVFFCSFLVRVLDFFHCRKGHVVDIYLFPSFDTVTLGQGSGHIYFFKGRSFARRKVDNTWKPKAFLKSSISGETQQGRLIQKIHIVRDRRWQGHGGLRVLYIRKESLSLLDKRLPLLSRKATEKECFCLCRGLRAKNSKDV